MAVEPTGEIQEFAPEELFFSATDTKGVIQLANDVFRRLSRYPAEALEGAPHNIIRHPDMPGAIFRMMWDSIEAGRPFAGYVLNLAADGSEYDVFATITPLPDGSGYLSVRSKPERDDLYATVIELYSKVRAAEREWIAAGTNRREAAERGVGLVEELVRELGYGSYAELQNELLPAEVAAREAATETFPAREGTSQLHEMLGQIREEYAVLDAWMAQQDDLARMSTRLGEVVGEVTADLAQVRRVAGTFTAAAGTADAADTGEAGPTAVSESVPEGLAGRPAGLGSDATGGSEATGAPASAAADSAAAATDTLLVWNQMQGVTGRYLTGLIERFEQLDAQIAQARFHIAMARMHSNTAGFFVSELIDTGYDAKIGIPGEAAGFATRTFAEAAGEVAESADEKAVRERLESLEMLSQVLTEDVEVLRRDSEQYHELADSVAAYLEEVRAAVSVPRQLLQLWQLSARRAGMGAEGRDLADVVESAVEHAGASLARFETFSHDLTRRSRGVNFEALAQIVLQIHAKVLMMEAA
ncbi:aerotaxis receptor [Arcanobacterium wilhelmae]|uniref:Aerotaxis receptor n=1 Tax=Arcanobacterium wilhelmae TaxID=1803177 RepID=A0ABT9NBH5_9ACTO|nr:PAS domain-containing protein [Arcanobacterium wilhelmae]MDP9801017.1 aerotaxis receptor [Arcanobacterium wilhelmae]WFN90376.1 PAS domain-containing protein [Arcanobacterium wilhelmae]